MEQVRDFIVSQEWGKRYELIFSSDHLLELTRRGATKGGMILKLAKLLGVARKDIYCIGDHNNDIPMLEVSEIGFAPENAIPEVKEWVRTSSATARTARWRTWWKFSTSDINLKKMAEPSF